MTNADADIKEKGTEYFDNLVLEWKKGRRFLFQDAKTAQITSEMFFYRFGLLKYYRYYVGAVENQDNLQESVLAHLMSISFKWLNSLQTLSGFASQLSR